MRRCAALGKILMQELTNHVVEYLKTYVPEFGSDPILARTLLNALVAAYPEGQVISSDGSLYLFDGAVWNRIEHNTLISMALLFDGLWLDLDKPKRLTVGLAKAQSVASTTLLIHDILKKKHFETVPLGVAGKEGFWTATEDGIEMLEHSPDHLCTWSYDFAIDDKNKPNNWYKFLWSLWRDDPDVSGKVDALQEWMGCCLIGRSTSFARCLLLVGKGGNGKSVIMDAIAACWPEDQVTSASPKRWDHDYTLASLRDSRLNICAELPEYNALESSDMFKSVIAGDRCAGRLPYQPPFSFVPRAGHIFSANALPSIGSGDYSDGFFRRFLIMSFNRSFTNDYALERRSQDEILGELKEEQASIVYWALEGAVRLAQRGAFTLPESHRETIAQWHSDSDPVKDFTEACCTLGDSTLSDLFADFKDFCSATGRRHGSSRGLAKRLRLLGYTHARRTTGTHFNLQAKARSSWSDCPIEVF